MMERAAKGGDPSRRFAYRLYQQGRLTPRFKYLTAIRAIQRSVELAINGERGLVFEVHRFPAHKACAHISRVKVNMILISINWESFS